MFIVVEGLDGSGKSTQLRLLRNYLEEREIDFRDIHFPRLNMGVYGALVAEFLKGDYGTIESVHPKLVALLYAGDRKEHLWQIQEWLDNGYLVIADRYVNSNIAFQCAKIEDEDSKSSLKNWIMDLEFGHHQLVKPDLSVFLDVPMAAIERSLNSKRTGADREYLDGHDDIHEKSTLFQAQVREEYIRMTEEQKKFVRLECYDKDENYHSTSEIHHNLIEMINPLLSS